MVRRLGIVLVGASTLALGGSGCGGGDNASILFTRGAMTSVPAVDAATVSGLLRVVAPTVTGTVADYPALSYLFRKECQHVPEDNYCPPSVHPTTDLRDPTRFEMGSLIGMVYHAQLYTGTLVTDCSGSGLTPATVSAASYHAASVSALADPTRFVLEQYPLLTCRSTQVSSPAAETRMVSAVPDGSYQAALHTRYRYDTGNGPQTDLFQVYVAMASDGTPRLLALNFAAATPHASRAVLLANLTDHRFALKYYVPSQPDGGGSSFTPAFYALAVGVGGYDLATGAANPGHYWVSLSDSGGAQVCVDNAGGTVEAMASCSGDSVPTTWTSAATIAAYLDIPTADAARLAAYLDVFAAASPLGPDDAWAAAGDDDRYWPASLH
jgi:hypothetical protein